MENLINRIFVPVEQRKRTTLASNLYYDTLDIFDNKVVGYLNGMQKMTWFFKEYSGIDIVSANLNSQFAQVVFLTGMNAKNRVVGIDLHGAQNLNAMNDTNRILFCSGMFSFGKTNDFANYVGAEIRAVFEKYKNNDSVEVVGSANSAADEILKFKNLLDQGIITQEEFDAKKKQLLGL
ncbi:MAG: SHOCT domain-containing protein [Ruminococcaceae bacterium]|nr:SHOCT domain-containing protein [Oscillospiraceae bacterium]